ncbi:hypothetical protein PR202_ga13848 [Eleusine coracana subsp. coracana]|uniref:EF-hand domain-containing protein n=1 Tax=Eleusine coracana subsp. coracana TaxID=191504 RepID=A0AAV5CFR8_ELECO|nr:hypothetical protein PR202_ga13848 [Eleusine coracana subsp. coracana]
MSGGDQQHQWPRPGHGYNPDVQWYGAASTSAPGPWAAAAQGMNPYAYASFPQFAPNPLHGVVNNLLFQNPAALTVFHQLQQQQQVQHVPSHVYHQNPSRGIQSPSANRAVSSPGQPQQKPQPQNQQVAIGKAQAAATKAREELLKSGEGVTGWKLAQAVLVALKVDSWDSLGVQLHDVPLLRDIFLIEGKVSTKLCSEILSMNLVVSLFEFIWALLYICQVNTFIHCYVAARKIVTVHDLEVEICKNEGVEKFEELGLGPFLQHPLVVHYFAASADLSMVPKLSSEEVISFLHKFMDNSTKKITVEEFLDYLVEQFSVSGKEKLGVRVQSLGLHISFLRQARRAEKPVRKMRESGDSSREKISKKSNLHTDKQALDKRFNSITSRIKQLPGINKHIHFDLTDDEVDGNSSSEDDKLDKSESKKGKLENFITTWKETCREHPVQQVLEMIANYYARTSKEKKRIINFCSQYPGIGLFNVAVSCLSSSVHLTVY